MPVPFKERLRAFVAYKIETLCILIFVFGALLAAACVALVLTGRWTEGWGVFTLRLVEAAILMRLNYSSLRNRLVIYKNMDENILDIKKALQNDFLGGLLELNEEAWLAEERRQGHNPTWAPFAVRCAIMAEAQKTNEGVEGLEEAFLAMSPSEREHVISTFHRMWVALELRISFLSDAVRKGDCEPQYAAKHIEKAELERNALVAAEIYAMSLQIFEHVRGSWTGMWYGYRNPRLREAMWKASNISRRPTT